MEGANKKYKMSANKQIEKLNKALIHVLDLIKAKGPGSHVSLAELKITNKDFEFKFLERLKHSEVLYYNDIRGIITKRK